MKRFLLVFAFVVLLLTNILASQNDLMNQLSLNEFSTKSFADDNRHIPAYSFAIEPVEIMSNYYDYFPGSYSGIPIQRVQTPLHDGNWLVFQGKASYDSNRRVYKTLIDNTGNIVVNYPLGYYDRYEGFPAIDLSADGRPIFVLHSDLDDGEFPELEVSIGVDPMNPIDMEIYSALYPVIYNPMEFIVNGQAYLDNQFIWPSLQIADSPLEGHQRVYVLGRNSVVNGIGPSQNILIYYKDFTGEDIDAQMIDGLSWQETSIPQLNEWNVSEEELRAPNMSFIAHEDKLYYIGYHEASTEDNTPIIEANLTVFVCDNYGQGEWEQYSTFANFASMIPRAIDPYTGEFLADQSSEFPSDLEDSDISNSIGESSHFNASLDNEGRIHFPLFYTLNTVTGISYPSFHTVKQITFDTNTYEWYLAEVYPQLDNGSSPFMPNDPLNITQYNSTEPYPRTDVWQWWDKDGDGLYDEILDDGTWDGIDDGYTATDTDFWGKPIIQKIWPYMYWDPYVADGAMMSHLHTAHITNANEQGMMAMVWQDANKSRLANLYPGTYPAYQNMCELVISVSDDNGDHWSEPIFLNGVDTPEMLDEIPEFPYLGGEVDYLGLDENGNKIGRVYVMYLDDNDYGSSVQNIGQASGGSMKYMALDIVFGVEAVANADNNVSPNHAMLAQNYPNPFNPTTRISYNVVKSGEVTLNVYNIKGQLVKTLVNGQQDVGNYNVFWNGYDNAGNSVSSGLYFYKVENAGKSEMKKMVLMK